MDPVSIRVGLPIAFLRLAEYHGALGLPPLSALPAPWRVEVGPWRIAVNATREPVEGIPPFVATAEKAGVLGLLAFGPHAGTVIGGWAGMEDELIAALERAIRATGRELEVIDE